MKPVITGSRKAYHCPECGSDNIGNDMACLWDEILQDWVATGEPYGYYTCNHCRFETKYEDSLVIIYTEYYYVDYPDSREYDSVVYPGGAGAP